MKKPDRPEMPPQKPRDPPTHVGYAGLKTCANCQHFTPQKTDKRSGACHNGISGRLTTRLIDGCAYGFYPDIVRYPIGPGPGGVFGVA